MTTLDTTPRPETQTQSQTQTQTQTQTFQLTDLETSLPGAVHRPGSPSYAAFATPWNVAAASTPIAVITPTYAHEVAEIVRYADAHDLDVAVQATGHGAWPYSRPTLLINTSGLDELRIDPRAATARVGAGVRWQRVLDEAAIHGLTGLAGSAPDVGVVGYLTGGGLSPMARTFGWAADRVLAFDVVTGDGELRRATPTQNEALFWGLRGGKGALGIVTAVEFELLAVTEIVGGALFFDGADATAVLQAWREWTTDLPREASTSIAFLRLPAAPFVPPPLAGRLTIAVRFAWVGDPAGAEPVLARIRSVAPVIFGGVGPMPVTSLGMIHSDPVDPMPVQESSALLRELSADAVDALVSQAGPESESPQIVVELRLLGGALSDPPAHASAVNHREAAFTLLTVGIAAPPAREATMTHAAGLFAAMRPWSLTGLQANFAASADPTVIGRVYDAATLTRLATAAATYDPRGRIAASHAVRAAAARSQGF